MTLTDWTDFKRMKLTNKITLFVTVGLLALNLISSLATWWTTSNDMKEEASQDQNVYLSMMETLVRHEGEKVQLTNGALMAGEYKINGQHAIPDAINKMTGSVASIFMNDVRISTSVKNDKGERVVGTHQDPKVYASMQRNEPFRGLADLNGVPYYGGYNPLVDENGKVVGSVGLAIPKSRYDQSIVSRVLTNCGIVFLAMIAMQLAINWLMGREFRQLQQVQDAMARLARQDTSVETPGLTRQDEIGEMARSVEAFRQGMIESERRAEEGRRLQQEVERQKAEADRLSHEKAQQTEQENERRAHVQAKTEELTREFDHAMNQLLATLGRTAGNLNDASRALNQTAQETSGQTAVVASATEETSTSVQLVAGAIQQNEAAVNEISSLVRNCTTIVGSTVHEAERTNEKIMNLQQATGQISSILQLISNIANQTNLLALNATIEAASAGEAGRGFTVVANEVKSLASQTKSAVEDIAKHIHAVQNETEASVQAIESILGFIRNINSVTEGIAAAVEEQTATSREITRSVDEAARGANEVAASIQKVAVASGQTQEAADQVFQTAQGVNAESDKLRRNIEQFLGDLKSVQDGGEALSTRRVAAGALR
ncbi:MAG: cache domain-containing protein [Vampirovibrionales bacterium]|nr:cache domain-containing protein [Vampirovibrionales bacterium]